MPREESNRLKRAVFLDRDGTLLDGWGSIFPGTRTQLLRLKDAGFLLIVVTNQPDIGAGTLDVEVLKRTNVSLGQVLGIEHFYVCADQAKDKSRHMKPEPGMLLDAAKALAIDLSRSFMVGDRWRDIGAGFNAGCTTVLLGTGYGEPFKWKPDHRASDLSHAVDIILESA